MKKKECIIFGSTGVLSKSVIELFYEKGFFIYGVSKKSKQSLKINNSPTSYLFNLLLLKILCLIY